MRRFRNCSILLVSVVVAATCVACGANVPCDELMAAKLPELFSIRSDGSDARGRIGEMFGLQASEVSMSRVVGSHLYSWTVGNRRFTWQAGQSRLELKWNAAPPTLGRVLQCLGTPDRYQAETLPTPDGPPFHSLLLWFESRNTAAAVSNFGLPWGYSELQETDRLVFVTGTTWEERLESAHGPGSFPVMGSVRSLRAWPGSLSKIMVGSDPFLR